MGYRRIFWIREQPIRRYLEEHGDTAELRDAIGRAILSFSAEDGDHLPLTPKMGASRPLFDEPDVFFPVRSMHSNAYGLFVWSGARLEVLTRPNLAMFEALTELEAVVGTRHVLDPQPGEFLPEYLESLGGDAPTVDASIWFVDQDFSRELELTAPETWPCRAVGASVLAQIRREKMADLFVGEWNLSEPCRSVGKWIDISAPEFALFAWTGRLASIRDVSDADMRSLRESLETGRAWLCQWAPARIEGDRGRSLAERRL